MVTRTWRAFAGRRQLNNGWHYERLGPEQWLKICFPRLETVAVEISEDTDGRYYAWASTDRTISMMWPTLAQFKVQFPFGYEAL